MLLVHRITNAYAGGQLVSRRVGGYVDEDADAVLHRGEDGASRRTDGGGSQSSTLTSTVRHFQPNHNHDPVAFRQSQQPRRELKAKSAASSRPDVPDGRCYSTTCSDYLQPLDQRVNANSSYSTLPKSLVVTSLPSPQPDVDYCACGQQQQQMHATNGDDDDEYPLPPPPICATGGRKFDGRHDQMTNMASGGSASEPSDMEFYEVDAAEFPGIDRQPSDIVRTVVARMLQSGAVPKAIVAIVLTLVFYVVARSTVVVLDAGLLTAVASASLGAGGDASSMPTGGAGAVDAVQVRIDEMNRYIEDEAKQLNDMASAIYGDQLRVELINLQALVEFFNAGRSIIIFSNCWQHTE